MMKKIKIILFIVICLFAFRVNASTNTYERTEDNLRVNKKWDINKKNINNVLNTPSVDASEKVYDFADILTDEEEIQLKKMIDKFIEHTGFDMVFVSDDFYYSSDYKNEEYAADFYDYNDFGIDIEHYSGVILLRNNYAADRYYGAYFFGDAQLYYAGQRTENVLDAIYYDFRNDNYMNGFDTFFSYLINYYNNGKAREYKNYYIDDNGFLQKRFVPPIFISFLIAGITTTIVISILVKKNKMVYQETKAKEYLKVESINFSVKNDQFISTHTSSYVVSSSSSGGGHSGGGGSHSGSSGGGHSGGGRHG